MIDGEFQAGDRLGVIDFLEVLVFPVEHGGAIGDNDLDIILDI